jgi:hypothetical protein
MKWFVSASLVMALCGVARADDVADAFAGFCQEWMQKLAAREQYNIANIRWETDLQGVEGTYIGYTRDHTCTMKIGSKDVPVGKITYREIRFAKRGDSIGEAESNPAQPLETTEITEIFRYAAGKWIY